MNCFELINISYRYNDNVVLDIKNISFPEKQVIALQGANGTGKTTLLNLLALICSPDTGTIDFSGEKITNENRTAFQKQIGYIQQNPYLFNLTVLQNVELGLKLRGMNKQARQDRAMGMLEQLGMLNMAHNRAHSVSGGEAQKIAIARTMVLEPEIILMDEPFTFLDKETVLQMEGIIQSIKENRTQSIIFSSHDQIRAQSLADHVYSLLNGKIIPAHMINMYSGKLDKKNHQFDTGKLIINVSGDYQDGDHIVVESTQIVLSKQKLESSMRNVFAGKIRSIAGHGNEFCVIVSAGEKFEVMITRAAITELGLQAGEPVWISFKSTAVRVY